MRQIDNYWNRFDESKKYHEILFRDGYGMQASEINEMESIQDARIRKLARALFKDGDVIRDAQILVNSSGKVNANAGEIFLEGRVWDVPAASFVIPVSGVVAVGVRLVETIISEMEDPNLRNPAIGHATAGEPGAWRKKIEARWAYNTGQDDKTFYPVYEITDGMMAAKEAPPSLDAFNQAISRYDRDSTGGGTYVCNGMLVRAQRVTDLTKQKFNIDAGRARVNGNGIEMLSSWAVDYPTQPDLKLRDTEVIIAKGGANERVIVAHPPVWTYDNLRVTHRKTVSIIHGNYSGCTDAMPDDAILQIVSVTQAGVTYAATTDFVRKGDAIDWSPGGREPATGSTYSVTYDYLNTNVSPVNPDKDGFSISNAVAGSQIMITYKQALPRIDRLCITDAGAIKWVKGVANEYNAAAPQIPRDLLALASVIQDWRATPKVINDGVRVVPFCDMLSLAERVEWIAAECARTRLECDAATREAGAKVGLFVDPCLDDTMRDQGIRQTAAIVEGAIVLPIAATVLAPSADIAKPGTKTPTLAIDSACLQTLRTGGMQVNPYMAFAIPQGKAVIVPIVDRWTEEQTEWASFHTNTFYTSENRTINRTSTTSSWRASGSSRVTSSSTSTTTDTVVEELGQRQSAIKYLRQISVSYTLSGFGAGEILDYINFGGFRINPGSKTANAEGKITGSFTIPPNVPAGIKQIEFRGRASVAYATFTGQGTLNVTTLRQVQNVYKHTVNTTTVTTVRYYNPDPLAQTFSFERECMLCGVDLWFKVRGTTNAQVQIRQVENGMPTSIVLAEALVTPAQQVVNGGHTRVLFDSPLPVEGGTEYAMVILCNDAQTELWIAEGGKFDAFVQKFVTGQPYNIGVLLSSSNTTTWTPHQTKDLAFRMLVASYAQATSEISLGTVNLPAGTTDLIVMGMAELPTAACAMEYLVNIPGIGQITMAPDQGVSLPRAVSGAATIKARLYGDSRLSPVLWPGTQVIAGRQAANGDYCTRSIVATGAAKAVFIFDAYAPSGSTVTPQIQIDNGAWTSLNLVDSVQQGDGVVEYRYEKPLSGANLVKVKITLAGTPAARPQVSNVRLMASV